MIPKAALESLIKEGENLYEDMLMRGIVDDGGIDSIRSSAEKFEKAFEHATDPDEIRLKNIYSEIIKLAEKKLKLHLREDTSNLGPLNIPGIKPL